MTRLTLHQLCLRDVAPVDLPGIARGAGVDSVSVFVVAPSPKLDIFPRVEAGQGARDFVAACDDHGVRVHNVEVFSVGPETVPEDFLPALDLGAELGATRLTALVQDADRRRAVANMCGLADLAGERGIAVSVEFMKFSECRSIGAGAEFLREAGHDNLSLLVDPLHLFRTGGSVADLAGTNPSLIGAAQICDGPLRAPESPFGEAVENRGIPGEGEFPLPEFLAALPKGCPLDIEVPLKRFADTGVSPADRAARLVRATRKLLTISATA
ncbi:sugar phosphate isomerase/epimerase [Maritimibacter sp. DP1N21-5]|uniref:sugar phosphate isomerase/epimerase family protein n=1 Tax=Maritimibacter sp. DP1N21-5 TaxID=2836867 RepID=UPI001C490925|nr:sugar phosphate isomerase/epimerase [Maritimibacter sp. DP1N21-5]MBV7407447.1 sugar phosphate isomerase/epimerase [Maritimibacter sp. DP1N21-5]